MPQSKSDSSRKKRLSWTKKNWSKILLRASQDICKYRNYRNRPNNKNFWKTKKNKLKSKIWDSGENNCCKNWNNWSFLAKFTKIRAIYHKNIWKKWIKTILFHKIKIKKPFWSKVRKLLSSGPEKTIIWHRLKKSQQLLKTPKRQSKISITKKLVKIIKNRSGWMGSMANKV